MKSLNIKIPLTVATDLDDRGRLNPDYLTSFIITHLDMISTIKDKPINQLSYNYTCKVHPDLHKTLKLLSIENNLAMNDMVGRLLAYYYKER